MDSIINPFELENANDFNSPYEYKVKIQSFANKSVDLIMTKIKHALPKTKEAFTGMTTIYPKQLTDEEAEEKRLENIRRSVTRAKQAVHYAVRSMGADHMLTLTTRENITDRIQFFTAFKEFMRLVRTKDLHTVNGELILKTRKEKRSYLYVAVPELQERGAYHMHIACIGKQDIPLLRACWYVALGGDPNDKGENTKGAVNIKYRQLAFGRKSESFSTFQLVKYMTKYMQKSFDETNELGLKRYSSARNIPKPIVFKQFIWSSYANNGGDFSTACAELFAIANFMGVHITETWNPDEEIVILRGIEQ